MAARNDYRQIRFSRPPGATEVVLVRHAESAPYRDGAPFPLLAGQGDPPLDPAGVAQAALLADRLALEDLTALYVTTLQRTGETAAPLAARLGLTPIVEPELREVFLGEWDGGLYRKHLASEHPVAAELLATGRWDVIPGAEREAPFTARVTTAIGAIAERHPDQRVAVFTHGGVIGQLLATATGGRAFAFMSDNASISRLIIAGDRWILRGYNDTAHLAPLAGTDRRDLDGDLPTEPEAS